MPDTQLDEAAIADVAVVNSQVIAVIQIGARTHRLLATG